MNFGEIQEFEAKLGRKATREEIREEETRRIKEIKAYANYHMYTDVQPYEVVRVISDITVEVRPMKTKQIRFPQDFSAGGFVGHFHDNRSGQEYEYISDPEAPVTRIRWSNANRQWQQGRYMRFVMSDKPYKFHDYNF
jgi:hypothetical protein